jgi:hypothetical protein
MRVTDDVAVDPQRSARVCVTELPLHDFRRSARVDQEGSESVTERMKSAPRNPERVQDCPQMVLHDFV